MNPCTVIWSPLFGRRKCAVANELPIGHPTVDIPLEGLLSVVVAGIRGAHPTAAGTARFDGPQIEHVQRVEARCQRHEARVGAEVQRSDVGGRLDAAPELVPQIAPGDVEDPDDGAVPGDGGDEVGVAGQRNRRYRVPMRPGDVLPHELLLDDRVQLYGVTARPRCRYLPLAHRDYRLGASLLLAHRHGQVFESQTFDAGDLVVEADFSPVRSFTRRIVVEIS